MTDFSLPILVTRYFTYVLSDGGLSSHVATCWVISFPLHGTQQGTPRVYGTRSGLELTHICCYDRPYPLGL